MTTAHFLALPGQRRSSSKSPLFARIVCVAGILLPALAARADAKLACPDAAPVAGPAGSALYLSLRKVSQDSPFYKAAAHAAKLTGCTAEGDEDGQRIVYAFGPAVSYEIHASPGAGLTEQVLVLAQTPAQARTLAAEQEKAAWKPHGCGIDWKAAAITEPGPDAGTQVEVRRAAKANCSARLTVKGPQVIKLKIAKAG